MTKNQTFIHDGKTFEIRAEILTSRFAVRVFLDGKQVSPEYSASLEVGQDFFAQHRESIVEHLAAIAKGDIKAGVYYKA